MIAGISTRLVVLVMLAGTMFAKPAFAENPYFPLAVGWEWTFEGASGVISSHEVVGQTSILGHTVFEMRLSSSAGEQYYSLSPDGDVLWHGSASESHGTYWDPPVVIIKAGALPGESWTTMSQAYCDPGGAEPSGPLRDHERSAVAFEEISVPAGRFMALKIEGGGATGCPSDPPLRAEGGIVLPEAGVAGSPDTVQVFYYYVEDLGLAKLEAMVLGISGGLVLQSWTAPGVPTETRSWSSLKASFR